MVTPNYKSGKMPNTDFQFEEFEGLLGSFHLTLKPLEDSADPRDRADYNNAMQILNGFATRYGVQSPVDGVNNPRASETWGTAQPIKTNFSTMDLTSSFGRDFAVGTQPGTEDHNARIGLVRVILDVFDRKGIAKVHREIVKGTPTPTRVQEWTPAYEFKSLADAIYR